MANRPRSRPRALTAEETVSFKSLLEDPDRWPDFEELLKQVAGYGVDLALLLKILGRAQIEHYEYELQKSRRHVLEWVKDVSKYAVKLKKLADKLWKETGCATNMRAALDHSGWKLAHQKPFLDYACAIEQTAWNAEKKLTRPRERPKRTYKHRAIRAMMILKVPKPLRHSLLTDVGL